MRVPERTVDLSPAATVKTTKLYILDVKPKSPAGRAESEVLSCYGIEGGERTLPEEYGAYELRQKFAKRPGSQKRKWMLLWDRIIPISCQ